MPLDELVQVIETLKARIGAHRASLQASEALTRLALIQPVLRTLGWDTEDPSLVLPEFAVGGGWADYALLGADGKPAAVIEAKKLGTQLKNHRDQMVNYANSSGIRYACLTDGDHWELYEVFVAKPIDERRILQASIAADAAHEAALHFLLLWRPNMASGAPIEAKGPVLDGGHGREQSGDGSSDGHSTTPPIISPDWVALTSLGAVTGQGAPSAVRFPDGHQASVKNWRVLFMEVGMWLDRKGLIPASITPLPQRGRGYFLNRVPEHRDGRRFTRSVHLANSGLYVQTHGSAKQLVSFAMRLLEACDQAPGNVYVRPPGR